MIRRIVWLTVLAALLFLGWYIWAQRPSLPEREVVAFATVCATATAMAVLCATLHWIIRLAAWFLSFLALWGAIQFVEQRDIERSIIPVVLGLFALELQLPIWIAQLAGWTFQRAKESEAAGERETADSKGDVPSDTPPEPPPPTAQFRLWHLVAATTLAAIGLAIARVLLPAEPALPMMFRVGLIALVCFPGVVICTAIAMVLLLRDPLAAFFWGAVTVLALVALTMVEYFLSESLPFGRTPLDHLAWINAAIAAAVLLTVLLLRAAGFVFDRTAEA